MQDNIQGLASTLDLKKLTMTFRVLSNCSILPLYLESVMQCDKVNGSYFSGTLYISPPINFLLRKSCSEDCGSKNSVKQTIK